MIKANAKCVVNGSKVNELINAVNPLLAATRELIDVVDSANKPAKRMFLIVDVKETTGANERDNLEASGGGGIGGGGDNQRDKLMTAGGGAGVGVGGGVTSNGEEEEPRNLVRDLEAQRMKEVQYNREKNKPSSLQQLTMDINLEKRQAAELMPPGNVTWKPRETWAKVILWDCVCYPLQVPFLFLAWALGFSWGANPPPPEESA